MNKNVAVRRAVPVGYNPGNPSLGSKSMGPSIRIETWGDILRRQIINDGMQGKLPGEVIKGWKKEHEWGYQSYKDAHRVKK